MLASLFLAAVIANAPRPVRGDFDHDGKPDVAEVVPWRKGVYHLIIRRGARGHPVSVIDEISQDNLGDLFLAKKLPGRWETWCGIAGDEGGPPCGPKSIRLHGETLAFGTTDASEAVVIWNGRRFEIIWLDD